MDDEYLDYQWIHNLFSEVGKGNQDVTLIANEFKGLVKKEPELIHAAVLLFDSASDNPSIAFRSAELAKALANVSVADDKNPLQLKSFRDCFVQLAIQEMQEFKVEKPFSAKQEGIVNFLVLLYKFKMLSDVFVDYWLKTLESAKTKAAKFFIDFIQKIRSGKTEQAEMINKFTSQPKSSGYKTTMSQPPPL